MGFFKLIHKAIFDTKFYKDLLSVKKGVAVAFLIKQIILVALISAASQVYYLTDPKRGIVEDLVYSFSGIEIKNGILNPNRETPYFPPSDIAASVLDQLMGVPLFLGSSAESLFVIDTNSHINYPLKIPVFLFRSDRMELILNSTTTVAAPYEKLFPSTDSIVFTKDFIDKYIRKHSPFFFIQMFMSKLFITTFFLFFSVIFLALAAYFFRIDKSRSLKQHFKISFFAVTPITVGSVLIALSGVKISWVWNILIFLSTIVMFRAMLATSTPVQSSTGENE